jgi:hypothetical protein
MSKVEFKHFRVPARKDLLHFVEQNLESRVLALIGKDPFAWIEELGIINQILTGESLVAAVGLDQPPIDDKDVRKLGEEVFLYRGSQKRLRGLWIRDQKNLHNFGHEWAHYKLGTMAHVLINSDFSDVPVDKFIPENFIAQGQPIRKKKKHEEFADKRQILTFAMNSKGRDIQVYAKGAYTSLGHFYEHSKPHYRLTSLSSVERVGSETEMNRGLQLAELGANVPNTIGLYKGPVEEFLLVEEVCGKDPTEYLQTHRHTIIEQDAALLATLCLVGYRKMGFTDFDDKIFDGKNLHLVDFEELADLYAHFGYDYRALLLNPRDGKLAKFRSWQKQRFKMLLKDAIYNYQGTLLSDIQDKKLFVDSFYHRMGWGRPSSNETTRLLSFSKNYTTLDRYMAEMSEE